MNTSLKKIYLLYFVFKYKLFSIFIRQDNNTILFVKDFKYTLDYIENRHASTLYTKLEIIKEEKTNSKIKKMLKARYIYIDNYNVLLGYIPKKNKKIIQVWHAGMAIKTIGFLDEKVKLHNESDKERYKRVYDSVDMYIVASEHMKKVFEKSFLVDESKIEVLGYPKLDYYIDSKFSKEVEEVKVQNEYLLDALNILYIPTFRDSQEDNLKQVDFINNLYRDFGEDYNILYKLHNNVDLEKVEISGKEVLAQELEKMIEIADIVITDYSSIVLEVLMQKKSLIYYLYDYEKYSIERGLNIDIYDLPGIKTTKYEEVYDVIEKKKYKENNLDQLDQKFIPPNLKNGKREMITSKVIKKALDL